MCVFPCVLNLETYCPSLLKELNIFSRCYLCEYRENDRNVFGYFEEDGEIHLTEVPFPNDMLLPERFLNTDQNGKIFFSTAKKGVYMAVTRKPLAEGIEGIYDSKEIASTFTYVKR